MKRIRVAPLVLALLGLAACGGGGGGSARAPTAVDSVITIEYMDLEPGTLGLSFGGLIGINRAKELSLTGNYLDADTACAWGLVNRVVAPEDLLDVAHSLARDIISTEPVTRAEILRIMDAGWASTLQDGLEIEAQASIAHSRQEVRADKVAARRADIQLRGRAQSSAD